VATSVNYLDLHYLQTSQSPFSKPDDSHQPSTDITSTSYKSDSTPSIPWEITRGLLVVDYQAYNESENQKQRRSHLQGRTTLPVPPRCMLLPLHKNLVKRSRPTSRNQLASSYFRSCSLPSQILAIDADGFQLTMGKEMIQVITLPPKLQMAHQQHQWRKPCISIR
jgi:hypothetical protein